MLRGEPFDTGDAQLSAERMRARLILKALNDSPPDAHDERKRLIRELMPEAGSGVWIEPPFYCDYGTNIRVGDNVFFNFSCVILDLAAVTIGANTVFGPFAQIYTATHALSAQQPAPGLQRAKPVHIGDDVWVGGGAIICPGVRIGARAVIGAGSVVTRDIPEDVLAVGNPCRVVRRVDDV